LEGKGEFQVADREHLRELEGLPGKQELVTRGGLEPRESAFEAPPEPLVDAVRLGVVGSSAQDAHLRVKTDVPGTPRERGHRGRLEF
jgi:hypothetical protein